MVHRILFEGNRATGVRVESGGEVFDVKAEQIVLSAGAMASPQILMLSGVGPAGHLKEMGIPVVHELLGVCQNLRDHPLVAVVMSVKDSFLQNPNAPRAQTGIRYTAMGSPDRNDMQIMASNFSSPIGAADPFAQEGVRITCILELADGAGEVRLSANDPDVQPDLNYRYLELPRDRERLREAVRICVRLLEHGDFAIRGSIVDVFAMGASNPFRIDLFDDEIETLRVFDAETQRSIENVESLDLMPARETPLTPDAIARFKRNWHLSFEGLPTRSPVYADVSEALAPAGIEYYLPLFFKQLDTLFDYIPKSALFIVDEGFEEGADVEKYQNGEGEY